jgi:hypothetical protein
LLEDKHSTEKVNTVMNTVLEGKHSTEKVKTVMEGKLSAGG